MSREKKQYIRDAAMLELSDRDIKITIINS